MASIRDIFVRNSRPVWWTGLEYTTDRGVAKAIADADHNVKVATDKYLSTSHIDEAAKEKAYYALEQARYNRAILENLIDPARWS